VLERGKKDFACLLRASTIVHEVSSCFSASSEARFLRQFLIRLRQASIHCFELLLQFPDVRWVRTRASTSPVDVLVRKSPRRLQMRPPFWKVSSAAVIMTDRDCFHASRALIREHVSLRPCPHHQIRRIMIRGAPTRAVSTPRNPLSQPGPRQPLSCNNPATGRQWPDHSD